jgi:hypothetical protein
MSNAPPAYVPRTPQAPPPPVKKKLYKRRWLWVVIVLLAGIGGWMVLGGGGAPTKGAAGPTNTIVYSVTGSGDPTASTVTYGMLGNGNQNNQVAASNVPIPWSKTITTPDPVTAFSLNVKNGPVGLSYVTCTITENGELLITNTSKGPFAIASCDAAGTS